MKTSIIHNGKELTLDVLSIDEAVKAKKLTKQEGIEHHDWAKNASLPTDNKHFIYVDDTFAGIAYKNPSLEEAVNIAKDTIEWYS